IEGVEVVAEAVEPLRPKVALAEPELDAAALVLDVGEGQLAHDPARADDPAGDGDPLTALDAPVEVLQNSGDGVGATRPRRVRVEAGGAQAFELCRALLLQIVQLHRRNNTILGLRDRAGYNKSGAERPPIHNAVRRLALLDLD